MKYDDLIGMVLYIMFRDTDWDWAVMGWVHYDRLLGWLVGEGSLVMDGGRGDSRKGK